MPARFEDLTSDTRSGVHGENCQSQYMPNLSYVQDDIVISGFSGRLPESSSIDEFKKNLYEHFDMVTDEARRWPKNLFDLPARLGKLKESDLVNFDPQFFGVHQKQAECMDPQLRMMLEQTYESIVDAGFNPQELRGSRTGVYIGVSNSEVEQHWCSADERLNAGYGLTGCAKSMFANRISFSFDFQGPSYALDTACSSSMVALTNAFNDMKAGRCDSAIVAGANLTLKPSMSLQFHRLSMLSPEGKCRAFDAEGNGYVRSEAVVTLFLQRAPQARRVYATILNAKVNTDGFKNNGITYPSGIMQNQLINETYKEIGVNPDEVVYVEAHGTGTKVGDPQEVNSIGDFFCKDRRTPLLMGSVKSNMGHSEPASGTCSIAKMLIAMEEGVIPANLHFNAPNQDLPAIVDGRIKIVDTNLPWNGGIIGINSFGFGGANAHVIMKSNPKPKSVSPRDGLSKLVTVSGRTEDAVQVLLDTVQEHRDDEEYLGLLNQIHSKNIPFHHYRGYAVIDNDKEEITQDIVEGVEANRPIWYIYSGMGSQWGSMAKSLMQIDVFSKSIHRSADLLRPEGIDLIDIMTKSDDSKFDHILNSFVAIAAMQVALTDLLSFLGVVPDGIIGHSVGELGCAYADGCFTPEQTVLAAYWRGKSILDTKLPAGAMAAVGLSWDECHRRFSKDIVPACQNSSDSVTISGPVDAIHKIVEDLTAEGVFARNVKSAGFAFHSKYISDAGPKLRKSLDKIIPNPKNRTSRWLSSSIPEHAWNTPIAMQSSAGYHVNNLLSPVLFHDVLQKIPANAICIEIAPTGLLQAILKNSLKSCTHLSLVKRGHENNINFLLSNIGKLYAAGYEPLVSKLYRPISYPVGRGTPMINSKIGWDHSVPLICPKFGKDKSSGETVIEVDLSKKEDSYIAGHTIDGRILFPATGYLHLVWSTFASMKSDSLEKTAVVFENVVFHRATIMPKEGVVKFGINFFDGTGNFELCEGGSLAVSGRISIPEDTTKEFLDLEDLPMDACKTKEDLPLLTSDVYKELRLRGYDYSGEFRGIIKSDTTATAGSLNWEGNWVSFMDTMLQFSIMGRDLRELYLPTRLERVIIDPRKHLNMVEQIGEDISKGMPVSMFQSIGVIKSGGVEMRGLKASQAPRRTGTQPAPTLERYTFVPFAGTASTFATIAEDEAKSQYNITTALLGKVIENSNGALKIKVAEIVFEKPADAISAKTVQFLIENEPQLVSDVCVVTHQDPAIYNQVLQDSGIRVLNKNIATEAPETNCHVVMIHDVINRSDVTAIFGNLKSTIKHDGFIIIEESQTNYSKHKNLTTLFTEQNLNVISTQYSHKKVYTLLRPNIDTSARKTRVITITEQNFNWVEGLKEALSTAEQNNEYIYLVSQGEEKIGAVGLMNCVKNEAGGKNVRLYFIRDKQAAKFDLKSKFYASQVEKDLIVNVLQNDSWGTMVHLKLENQTEVATLPVEHAYVNTLVKGDLSSLRWIEGQLGRKNIDAIKAKNNELCTVYYAPINFRDVMLGSGKLSADALPGDLATQDCVMGLEFAGRDSTGKRIMALVPAKSLATTCEINGKMKWEIPANWTMEQASTIPCVYATAYYAIMMRGRAKKGESILIHAGSGGVGQAAIAISLELGLRVFTTVGNLEKIKFLMKTFPQLNENYIGNSRDTSFEQMVMRETRGKGVDLVLNSLAGESLQASVRCLGLNGRFLEIGKFDLNNNSPLGMSVFLKNTQFHGILLDSVMEGDDQTINEVVELLRNGIKSGAVRPLPTSVYNETQVEQAFRFMASGKHIGKVVVKIREEEKAKVVVPSAKLINSIPRTYLHEEKSYVLVGGLGGFGLELAHWMVSRGTTKLVLTSRSGIKTGYQSLMIRRWRERGVTVKVDTNDVTTAKGAESLLKEASKLGPVGGIFNLAAVLRDGLIQDQTADAFKAVCVAKVDATKNLDEASRTYCPELDYFICFSSVSCGRGNIGQTNYGMANSAMERICESRQKVGLPATAIQWGAIGDTGLVIDTLGDNDTVIGGTLPQRMVSCLQTMDTFMQQHNPVVASMVIAEKRKADSAAGVSIVSSVLNVLGIKNSKNISDNSSLADLGLDSLMGAEIKQNLERNFDIILNAQEIRSLTLGKLKAFESGESVSGTAASQNGTSSSTDSTVDFIGNGTEVEFAIGLIPDQCLVRIDNNRNAKGTPIFLIHAIEGDVDALIPLAAKLKSPVYGLQCTREAPMETIPQLAEYYVNHIQTVQSHGPYNIAGYSFGACVAFEMILQLEKKNEKCRLVMLDGAPKYVSWYTTQYKMRSAFNTPESQSLMNTDASYGLAYFAFVSAALEFSKMFKELETLDTFEKKVLKCAQSVRTVIDQPVERIAASAESFFKKLLAAHYYQPAAKIKSAVVLIKPTENYNKLSDDYDLKTNCEEKVQIQTVPGDHRSILKGASVDTVSKIFRDFVIA